jgi:hypothetical protein
MFSKICCFEASGHLFYSAGISFVHSDDIVNIEDSNVNYTRHSMFRFFVGGNQTSVLILDRKEIDFISLLYASRIGLIFYPSVTKEMLNAFGTNYFAVNPKQSNKQVVNRADIYNAGFISESVIRLCSRKGLSLAILGAGVENVVNGIRYGKDVYYYGAARDEIINDPFNLNSLFNVSDFNKAYRKTGDYKSFFEHSSDSLSESILYRISIIRDVDFSEVVVTNPRYGIHYLNALSFYSNVTLNESSIHDDAIYNITTYDKKVEEHKFDLSVFENSVAVRGLSIRDGRWPDVSFDSFVIVAPSASGKSTFIADMASFGFNIIDIDSLIDWPNVWPFPDGWEPDYSSGETFLREHPKDHVLMSFALSGWETYDESDVYAVLISERQHRRNFAKRVVRKEQGGFFTFDWWNWGVTERSVHKYEKVFDDIVTAFSYGISKGYNPRRHVVLPGSVEHPKIHTLNNKMSYEVMTRYPVSYGEDSLLIIDLSSVDPEYRYDYHRILLNFNRKSTLLTFSPVMVCNDQVQLDGTYVCLHFSDIYNEDDIELGDKEFVGYMDVDLGSMTTTFRRDPRGDVIYDEVLYEGYRRKLTLEQMFDVVKNRYLIEITSGDFMDREYKEDVVYAAFSISNTYNSYVSTISFMEKYRENGIFIIPNRNAVSVLEGRFDIKIEVDSFTQRGFSDWVYSPAEFVNYGYGVCQCTDLPFKICDSKTLLDVESVFVGNHSFNVMWFAVYPLDYLDAKYETDYSGESHYIKKYAVVERGVLNFTSETEYDLRRRYAISQGYEVSDQGEILELFDDGYYPIILSGHLSRAISLLSIGVFDINAYIIHIEGNLRGLGNTNEGVSKGIWHSLKDWLLAIDYAINKMRSMQIPIALNGEYIKEQLNRLSERYDSMNFASLTESDGHQTVRGSDVTLKRYG